MGTLHGNSRAAVKFKQPVQHIAVQALRSVPASFGGRSARPKPDVRLRRGPWGPCRDAHVLMEDLMWRVATHVLLSAWGLAPFRFGCTADVLGAQVLLTVWRVALLALPRLPRPVPFTLSA